MKKSQKIRRTSNNIAGVAGYTAGELAVLRTMVRNDVKTTIRSTKAKQKTIGAKQQNKRYRRMA